MLLISRAALLTVALILSALHEWHRFPAEMLNLSCGPLNNRIQIELVKDGSFIHVYKFNYFSIKVLSYETNATYTPQVLKLKLDFFLIFVTFTQV